MTTDKTFNPLKTYTALEFYDLLNKQGALTPEIIGIVQDLQPQRQFVLPVKFAESSSDFQPKDLTTIRAEQPEELEKIFTNCKHILERLSGFFIFSPMKIGFGRDRLTALTIEIEI